MKIAVTDAGYAGLSDAVMLAQHYHVKIYDTDKENIEKINNRISPVQEHYMEKYFHIRKLNLVATDSLSEACKDVDFVIVSVAEDQVDKTIDSILSVNPEATIVLRSNVAAGTTERIRKEKGLKNIFYVPEFLRNSDPLYDNMYPSRLLIGIEKGNKELRDKAIKFIHMVKRCALKEDIDVLFMEETEAETVKIFSNTYLAMRVSFFNELDTYAETKGLDSKSIIKGMGLDPRIGNYYNNPSFGYGGDFLPKYAEESLENYGDIPQDMIGAIVKSNETRKSYAAKRIMETASEKAKENNKEKAVIGVYRLSMKSNSDNLNNSAIFGVIEEMNKEGAEVVVYEPALGGAENFQGHQVISDLDQFKGLCDLVVANRYEQCLEDVSDKLYTRDLFFRD